jgi:hypothetical protein
MEYKYHLAQEESLFVNCLTREDESNKFLWDAGNYLPSAQCNIPADLNIQKHCCEKLKILQL